MSNIFDNVKDAIQERRLHGMDAKASQRCLNFDVYGRQVALTFQGSDQYRTKVGACMTILVSMMLLTFGTYRLLWNRNEIILTQQAIH